jgi:hypothetical protein
MLPQNEGPRSSQQEDLNERADTLSGATSNNPSTQPTLSGATNNSETVEVRTPERWWLRKRLLQGQ